MNNREKLFEKFPPVSTERWMAKITADLKDADFSKRMVWKNREGFEVMPFYRQEDLEGLSHINTLPGEFTFVRGSRITGNEWLVRQDVTVNGFEEANAGALDILLKGVTSLGFIIADSDRITAENITLLLKGIH